LARYKKPEYRELGDLCVGVEYGDTSEIALSFMVNALVLAIKKRGINGILETLPTARSLGVLFDPRKIEKQRLIQMLKRIEREENLDELTELPSRLIKIPVWFNDPWSDECARAHCVENNLQFVAKLNGVSADEVIRVYTSTRYWIAGTAFLLGTFASMALEPHKITLKVPKCTVPRKWTYEGCITIAGASVGVHSVRAPGGFQLVGRTPIDIYDPQQRNPIFRDEPILVKATDRVEFHPISGAEYHRIRREVEEGTYRYEVEQGICRLSDYNG
jgi:KipI family sensor histidine kinase inhibitor